MAAETPASPAAPRAWDRRRGAGRGLCPPPNTPCPASRLRATSQVGCDPELSSEIPRASITAIKPVHTGVEGQGSGHSPPRVFPPENQQLTPNQGLGLRPSPDTHPLPPLAPQHPHRGPRARAACPPHVHTGAPPTGTPHLHPCPRSDRHVPHALLPARDPPRHPSLPTRPAPAPAAPHGPHSPAGARCPRVPPALRPGPAARRPLRPRLLGWAGRAAAASRHVGRPPCAGGGSPSVPAPSARPPPGHARPLEIPLRRRGHRGAPWASVSSSASWGGREGRVGAVAPGKHGPPAAAGAEGSGGCPHAPAPAHAAHSAGETPARSAPLTAHFSHQTGWTREARETLAE